mmetsp:Transcript_7851/g.35644  ORF Transcript_7851/g.35644 Transcript_7851/m.35644 type:complete len:229 (+) Transcript_7851:801-1487(+)
MDASLSPAAGFTPSASPPVLVSPAAVLLSLEPVLLKPPPSGSNFASSFGRSLGLLGANASVSISDMRSLTASPNAVDGDAHWSRSIFIESSRFLPTEPGVAIEPAAIAATASSASPKEGSRASAPVGLAGLSSSMLLDGVSNTSVAVSSSSVSSSSSSREISTFSSPFFGLVGVELDVPVPHDLRTSGMTSGAGGEIAAGEAGDPLSDSFSDLSDPSSFSFSGDADFE